VNALEEYNRRTNLNLLEAYLANADTHTKDYLSGELFQNTTIPFIRNKYLLFHYFRYDGSYPYAMMRNPDQLEERVSSQLKLLQLKIAARLHELDKGSPPKTSADLMPEYLPEIMMNPLTSQPYTWKSDGKLDLSSGVE
jgi:lysyl-tRNA synthetase class II